MVYLRWWGKDCHRLLRYHTAAHFGNIHQNYSGHILGIYAVDINWTSIINGKGDFVAKKEEPQLTHTVWVKVPFGDEKKLEVAKQMADTEAQMFAKSEELDLEANAFKETKKRLEGEISAIQLRLHDHAVQFRQGYEDVKHECIAAYHDNMVKFTDKDTGEVVEERPMTEAEQLRLSGKMVDAEQVIRQASEEDDE